MRAFLLLSSLNVVVSFGGLMISSLLWFYRVDGDSMFPTLKHRDYVLTTRLITPKIGNIVVAKHPEFGVIVKRIIEQEATHVRLEGDNLESSTSTEKLGWIENRRIKGTVVHVFTP